jgi:hypothetical protein
VSSYVQWNDTAQEEYDTLLAEEENQEVTTMKMTWGDRMMEKGRVEGRVEGMRTLVLGQIESRFGAVPADRKRRIEAIDSTDELTRLADRLLTARSLDELGI